MPRSAFFSKEAIAEAGLEIIRRQGVEALTARSLSKQLGCSLGPIFTVFKDMDEIHTAVWLHPHCSPTMWKTLSTISLHSRNPIGVWATGNKHFMCTIYLQKLK